MTSVTQDGGRVHAQPSANGRTATLPVDPGGPPRDLIDGDHWLIWRPKPRPNKPGKWEKIPYRAAEPSRKGSSTDPETWSTFGAAFSAYQADPTIAGVGVALNGQGITGIDLDEAIGDDDRPKPWAQAIMDRVPAYWERSPFGRGLRGLGLAELPPGRRKIAYRDGAVEMYDSGRFLTITGQAVRFVDRLPNIQAEVEALHADLMGGEGLEAAAIVTRMTGPAADVSPEAMAVLERVMGGRYAEQMAKVWSGDYSDFGGDESSGEWALARETVFHAMALGHAGDELADVVEQVLRAGAYRDKWDSPRTVTLPDKSTIRTTWLGMTIGRAIKSRERKDPELMPEEDTAPADPFETPEQIIARLERELARERTVGAVRETVIRTQRARLEVLEPIVTAIDEVLQRPDEELGSDDKVATIALARWMPFHYSKQAANGERPRVSLGYLAKVVGMPKRRLSKSLDRLSSDSPDDGAPFCKIVTRRPKFGADGSPVVDEATGRQLFESTLEVSPWAKTTTETLRTVARYDTPPRPKRGGSKPAAEARWGRCQRHEAAEVIVKGVCSDCGKALGEGRVSAADFEALGQNVQLGHSDFPQATAVVEGLLVGVQNGHPGHPNGSARRQNVRVVDPDPALDAIAAAAVAVPMTASERSRRKLPPEPNGHVNGSPNGHPPPEMLEEPPWLKDVDWATRERWHQEQAGLR